MSTDAFGPTNAPACRLAASSDGQDHQHAMIHVYLDDGTKFKYECPAEQAREHVHAIVMTGYRRCVNGTLTHYPPHRILKVKAMGNQRTEYVDTVSGT